MRDLILGITAAALFGAAGYVMAQTTTQDKPHQQPSTTPTDPQTGKPVTDRHSTQPTTNESATAAAASSPDRDTQLRLARMDTSVAAFRKLDKDNDGRISPLEAADNPKLAAAFTVADRDHDGYLSREEFEGLGTQAHPSSDADASSPSGDRASEPRK
jgi:hypothetical protein